MPSPIDNYLDGLGGALIQRRCPPFEAEFPGDQGAPVKPTCYAFSDVFQDAQVVISIARHEVQVLLIGQGTWHMEYGMPRARDPLDGIPNESVINARGAIDTRI